MINFYSSRLKKGLVAEKSDSIFSGETYDYSKAKQVIKSNPSIPYIKYKFGANELYIGKGLISVLNYLEQKYDIDFNALAKKK